MGAKSSGFWEGETWWGEPCIRIHDPLPAASGFEWQLLVTYVVRDGRLVVAEMTIHVPIPGHGSQLDQAFYARLNPWTAAAGTRFTLPGLPGPTSGFDPDFAERVKEARDELPAGGLTSSDARANLSGIRNHEREALQWLADHGDAPPLPIELPKPKAASAQQGRALGDDYYAKLTEDYLRVAAINAHQPQKALLAEYRAGGVADVTARRLKGRLNLAVKHRWLERSDTNPSTDDDGRLGRLIAGPRLHERRKQQAEASKPRARKGKVK